MDYSVDATHERALKLYLSSQIYMNVVPFITDLK
jgi:hypothetical protein